MTNEIVYDRWRHGLAIGGDSVHRNFTSFQSKYSRTGSAAEQVSDYFLRSDQFQNHVTRTPFTFIDIFQSWGSTWAFIGITIGVLASGCNRFANSRLEMEQTVNAYIRAVAWGMRLFVYELCWDFLWV